jgi:hypothetical protein
MATWKDKIPSFRMQFQPQTIEHLGLRLYSSLPPVIAEVVTNAWDAEANRVDITFPTGTLGDQDEVIVSDDGHGMTAGQLQADYLEIGRNRRAATKSDTSESGTRRVTGRKGLGKLAVFGVASELEVRTVRDKFAVTLRLNYDKMKKWPKGQDYEPDIVMNRSGPTKDGAGTEVRIRSLHRTKPIQDAWLRRGLARRFRMIGQGQGFEVYINGQPITAADQRLRQACKRSWDVTALDVGGAVDADNVWNVTGWIGVLESSSQTDRGVDIYARGKAVELDSMFESSTTHKMFARAYVVGEVNAEFLDDAEDNIATARNTVNWESDAGQALQKWGDAALREVFNKWAAMRETEKRERVVKVAGFDQWLKTRTERERRVANKLLNIIVRDQTIEPEAAAPLLEIIKTNIEFVAFQDLVDDIEESGANVELMLRLMKDWRIVEARERLRMADGRLAVAEQLAKYIDEGALEVQQMQPLFEENTWLIDPTWGDADGQTTYTNELRKHCKEPRDIPASDRRLDILGVRIGGELNIVELKRPEKTLSRKDLEQIEAYLDWARSHLIAADGNREAPSHVTGRLIVGKRNPNREVAEKERRLGGEIGVLTYKDILHQARVLYALKEKQLKKLAPEYTRSARKAKKAASKKGLRTAAAKKKGKRLTQAAVKQATLRGAGRQ